MNLNDLKQVLDERSADSTEDVLHHLRLQGVRTRVVARRRRRAAAWGACAVAVLAGVTAAAVVPGLRTDNAPTPQDNPSPVRMIEGFPEYANGARVVAARSAVLPERRVEVTVVPTTVDLAVFTRCAVAGDGVSLQEEVTVNGHALSRGSCGGSSQWGSLAGSGVAVGKPATFVMAITGARRWDGTSDRPASVPDAGTWGLAIGERIPFTQYPLPARPSGPLGPLTDVLPAGCTEAECPKAVIIRSDPADHTRTVRRTVIWKPVQMIAMVARTPGLLEVRVDGVRITTGEWWDYEMGGVQVYGDEDGAWKREFGLDLRAGDPVTIEIVPRYVTGDWQVVFSPDGE